MLIYVYLNLRKAKYLSYVELVSITLSVEEIGVELSVKEISIISRVAYISSLCEFIWFVAISVLGHYYSETEESKQWNLLSC